MIKKSIQIAVALLIATTTLFAQKTKPIAKPATAEKLASSKAYSEEANLNLRGTFITQNKDALYRSFSFDNNGKVRIDDFANGDYFIKGDTLFIFLDKDVFKFIIKNEQLIGVSNWVDKSVWKRSKALPDNRRVDENYAQEQAKLLCEYYEKTRKGNDPMTFLFDENKMDAYKKTIEGLCNRNLVRACKEWFGLEIMEEMGGLRAALDEDKRKPITANKKLQDIVDKTMKLDSVEGQILMGLYEGMLDYKVQKPDLDAPAYTIATENKEIKLDDLQRWNLMDFKNFQTDVTTNYGFRLMDKTEADEVEVQDFENQIFDRLRKFINKDVTKNQIEYKTYNLGRVFEISAILMARGFSKTEEKTEQGNYFHFKSEKPLNKDEDFKVSILYPSKDDENKQIIIMLFKN